jgi:hypothetical protein
MVMLHFKYKTNILLFRQIMMLNCDVLRIKFVQVRARVLLHAPDNTIIADGVLLWQ